jgi:hypothetical protein
MALPQAFCFTAGVYARIIAALFDRGNGLIIIRAPSAAAMLFFTALSVAK